MLEQRKHSSSVFVTLTYEDQYLPKSKSRSGYRPTLEPKDAQDWLKRLRWQLAPSKVRFFLAGEYGTQTERPHYHAAIFGSPQCERGRTLCDLHSSRRDWRNCCSVCRIYGNTWGHGDIDVGTLAENSAQYLCGYITKKMTRFDDARLDGRHPEFVRMSLRPGIGLSAMSDVAAVLEDFNLVDRMADVPSAVRMGRRLMPLGRYLRRGLREMLGRDPKTPQSGLDEHQAKVQALFDRAFNSTKEERQHKTVKDYYSQLLAEADEGTVNQRRAQRAIYKKERKL